ncbi:MAG TPA: CpsB/CapC family capsule biosynthesis tyrosine phosphatase [Bacteroidia bacterium]|jgi:tyrosine-protein phosphatase YwqE
MGLFNLFSKKTRKLKTPVDLSVLHCDIHSHFIPGIDDGAKTMDDSLQMITAMHNMGYKKLITSPHTMSDYYRNTSEIIMNGAENIKTALKEADVPVEFGAVSEYYLDHDFERKIEEEQLLTFGDKYLLFEISYMNPPDNLYHVIFQMQLKGYKPVLAHPERYNFWHTDFDKYEAFIDKGVLLQMNINSLSGYYSLATKKIAEKMIDKNMISFLGSDCHHMGHINLMKEVVYQPYLQKLIDSEKLLNKNL